MATRKNRGKSSKGRKNRTQKGGFISAIKRMFGVSNNQQSDLSQNGNESQLQQTIPPPEMKFGGKKSRGRRNK